MYKFCWVIIAILMTTILEGKDQDYGKKIEKWLPSERMNHAITNCAHVHELFTDCRQVKLNFIKPVTEDRDFFAVFIEVKLPNSESQAIFRVTREKATQAIRCDLPYITTGNPLGPAPVLFCDILYSPGLAAMYPQAIELYFAKNATLRISSKFVERDLIEQTWTFRTSSERCDVLVVSQGDGRGGTDFAILAPR